MRIVAGIARGRKLQVPRGKDVRPTADRVREALFSYLGYHVENAIVLDLFAGSGALGLEALSRGAKQATFVEVSKAHLDILYENIKGIGLESQSRVLRRDAKSALSLFENEKAQYNLIFLDPPYASQLLEQSLELIQKTDILKQNGLIIAEHSKNSVFHLPDTLHITRTRSYGNTSVTTIEKLKDTNV